MYTRLLLLTSQRNLSLMLYIVLLITLCLLSRVVSGQVFAPEGCGVEKIAVAPVEPLLDYVVVSKQERDKWPTEERRHKEVLKFDKVYGGNPAHAFNLDIWANRVVFSIDESGEVAFGQAFWRRSALSVRIKGLKLLSAETNEEITDARLIHYDQEKVVIEFRPVSGPGEYYLYYGAYEPVLFEPSQEWLKKAQETTSVVEARSLRIEARTRFDNFYPMEIVPLKDELEKLLSNFPAAGYLVFPQDRDQCIKMYHEIPACWVFAEPDTDFVLKADRNEYRVFQIGVWACRAELADVEAEFSDFKSLTGNSSIPADWFGCLTLTSRIKSRYLSRPTGPYRIDKGQVRALWCGIDLPTDVAAGKYSGFITIKPKNQPATKVPVSLIISNDIVEQRGDLDSWRLSRLRWVESNIGLENEIFPPFKPLEFSEDQQSISTWGHTLILNKFGMPAKIRFGDEDIIAYPATLTFGPDSKQYKWRKSQCRFTEVTDDHVSWFGEAESGQVKLLVDGRIEFDGLIVITLKLETKKECSVDDLTFDLSWHKEHAELAAGMGYRGRRERDRIWRSIERQSSFFDPSLWLGSIKAGLVWITWETKPWEDASRIDAATVTEKDDKVVLQLNLGSHKISPDRSWSIQFALRPTPVKPVDQRHWQFRYFHPGSAFTLYPDGTPQSFLKDDCKRLDWLTDSGVKRLNLHDWWGPCCNYPRQWDGPDNLSRLTKEAHTRGIYVKVSESGREISTHAPEYWALISIGHADGIYKISDRIDPDPVPTFQDAWKEAHLPEGLSSLYPAWTRLHDGLIEHTTPLPLSTRNGNFYLESMRYMVENFGVDGAYWDGAVGQTLGGREIAKRLWTIFKKVSPNAVIDDHHGTTLSDSLVTGNSLMFGFVDSVWHGEGACYGMFDPWDWLVEVAAVPFGVPSEMLGGEDYLDRGMLFGIWPRMAWAAGTEKQQKLWAFFDTFGIEQATMLGWWTKDNGVIIDRPDTYVTVFSHPSNGCLLVVASWHPALWAWVGDSIDVSLLLDRGKLRLGDGSLLATDIMTDEELDIFKPVVLTTLKEPAKSAFTNKIFPFEGRLIWVRGK